MKVIGMCGSKGSGKSTAFEMLKEKFGDQLKEIPLADHLKQVCAEVSGLPLVYFTSQDYKEKELEQYILMDEKKIESIFLKFFLKKDEDFNYDVNIRPHVAKVFYTPRQMLQYVGTEILRPIDPLIHVKTVLKKSDETKVTVIPDMRFNSEFDYFHENAENFIGLYINNNTAETAASIDAHKSELEFREFAPKCIRVDNNGSLKELKENLLKIVDGKI